MVQAIETAPRRTRPPAGTRVPPHNLDAEQSLLGAMLLSRDAIAAAMETCGVDDFYKPAHAHVFDAINSLYNRGEPADPVTVADELSRAGLLEAVGGLPALVALQADTPATTNASRYARIIEEHALLRRLISVAGEIAEMGYGVPDDVTAAIDRAEALVFNVAERRVTDSLKPLTELLYASMDRLERLYDRGQSITGVPTGYVDLDEKLYGLQPSSLVIVGARPAMGKCVAWDTRVVDPQTGALVAVSELYGCPTRVLSLGEDRRLSPAPVSAWVDDGVKPVFKVRTRLGREIRTTAAHPFLTTYGWRQLADLAAGIPIAVPRVISTRASGRMDRSELVLLAYLLGDGTSRSSAAGAEVRAALVGLDADAGVGGEERPLVDLLRRHGMLGCRPGEKRVPDAVFRLSLEEIAVFLSRLLSTDGAVRGSDNPAGCGRVVYVTRSRRLVRDVQHLLLRFGISARIRFRAVYHGGGRLPGWELQITGREDLERFWTGIGIFAEGPAGSLLLGRVRGLETRGVGARSTGTSRLLAPVLDTPWTRPVLDDPIVEADICWDEIVSITPDGEDRVYDLTVPGTHNFVAEDMIVHNTAFALGMAAHAAMEARVPTLVFSLEMGSDELTSRLLVSEARVDSGRMRNGRLTDADWPKISQAVARLGDAPLFIDDNPSTTVMEIRAKARRLKARHGNLGLIIIDYLQLMQSHGGGHSAENRQLEVSAISRGLKILARELEVPVVALSQLSRQLEARADKRPVLADLRESGSLEQDADVVLFLYRDEMYNPESPDRGTAEVIVSKHRNGPTGKLQLAFLDHYTRFANMARV
jgi:replicative DNA helicase